MGRFPATIPPSTLQKRGVLNALKRCGELFRRSFSTWSFKTEILFSDLLYITYHPRPPLPTNVLCPVLPEWLFQRMKKLCLPPCPCHASRVKTKTQKTALSYLLSNTVIDWSAEGRGVLPSSYSSLLYKTQFTKQYITALIQPLPLFSSPWLTKSYVAKYGCSSGV